MSCPDPRALEALASGAGGQESRGALFEHIAACEACRKQWAWLRLCQLRLGASTPQTGHLDDETFCALADQILDEAQTRETLAHLAACPTCLSQWVELQRNLEVAEVAAQAPPEDLLERAAELGSDPTGVSWWSRCFGVAKPWRWGLAWATATSVLLATLWFSPEIGPRRQQPIELPEPPGAFLAHKPEQAQASPVRPEPELPTQPADRSTEGASSKETDDQRIASATTQRAEEGQPPGLLASARRSLPQETIRAPLVHALHDHSSGALSQGYELGRLLAYNHHFAKNLSTSEIRSLLAGNTARLSAALRRASQIKLAAMAEGLAGDLETESPDPVVVQARMKVLFEASQQWLEADPLLAAGVCLGRLDQGWQMSGPAAQAHLQRCIILLEGLSDEHPARKALPPILHELARAEAARIPELMRKLREAVFAGTETAH